MLSAGQVRFRNEALLRNLRQRWKQELSHLTDNQVITIYDDFAVSEYHGNNDEHFLQFIRDCMD